MVNLSLFKKIIVSASILALTPILTACGGGGGASSGGTTTPPPPPPPPAMSTGIVDFSVDSNDGPHRILMPGGHVDDTLSATCSPNVAGRTITWSSDFSGVRFDGNTTSTAEQVSITIDGSASVGSGVIICTDEDSGQTESVPVFIVTPSEPFTFIRNPLRFDADGTLPIVSPFVLNADTPASTDVNQCFATDLADLEARVAFQVNPDGIGNFCGSIHEYQTSDDANISVDRLPLKMYHIPGAFVVDTTPFVAAFADDIVLSSSTEVEFPVLRRYSDDHIFIGGDRSPATADDTNVIVSIRVDPVTGAVTYKSFQATLLFQQQGTYDMLVTRTVDQVSIESWTFSDEQLP